MRCTSRRCEGGSESLKATLTRVLKKQLLGRVPLILSFFPSASPWLGRCQIQHIWTWTWNTWHGTGKWEAQSPSSHPPFQTDSAMGSGLFLLTKTQGKGPVHILQSESCSVVSDSLRPHGLYPAKLLYLWDSPGKNNAVGCHFLLQGISQTQGSPRPRDQTRVSCISKWVLYHGVNQGSPLFSVLASSFLKVMSFILTRIGGE